MKKIIGFFTGNWPFLLGVLLTGGLVYFYAQYESRGEMIVSLKGIITDLKSVIIQKNDTIQTQRNRITFLDTTTANLKVDVAQKGEQIQNLKRENEKKRADALAALNQLAQKSAQYQRLVNSLSPTDAKKAADRPVGGVGSIPTTEKDTIVNKSVATLKSEIESLQSSYGELLTAYNELRDSHSELEDELNKLNGPKGPQIQLRQKEKQIADARASIQAKISKLSTLLARIFKSGQRKAYKEADAQFGQIQGKP